MTTVAKWSNVRVAVQSALGANKTITAITKASQGVVSATAHGFVAGDFVLITAVGMYQVDSRVFRVADNGSPVDPNAFLLQGEDTTLFDTFTSGYANLITFGTSMQTATGLTASGGDFDFIDTTTIHVGQRQQIPGLANAASYAFENLWDPSDTALLAFKSASDNQAQRAVKFTFAAGQIVAFNGYIGCTMLPTGTALDKVVTSVVATMIGRPTLYYP